SGARVLILERGLRTGRKILVTGNGRCNLTNALADDVGHYRGENPRFCHGALSRLPVADTLAFFEGLGVPCVDEGDGHYYPRSSSAADVADSLELAFREAGGEVVTNARVAEVTPGTPWRVAEAGGRSWSSRAVILAAGGRSAPKTGSDGGGFTLAERLGHRVTPLAPAIVPLTVAGNFGHFLQGVRVTAKLRVTDLKIQAGPAELMFAHYGLSGPLALWLSVEIGLALEGGPLDLELDLLPEMAPEEVSFLLQSRVEAHPRRELGNLLLGVLPRKVLPAVLRQQGLEPDTPCSEMRGELRERSVKLLKSYPLTCTGSRGWEEAAATLGGVDLGEVDPRTLESRRHTGLLFAGELLDVCGECGGFNLQWAWSSGYVAGRSAAGL
ncbi:MAG TPA: aminoacetone oxidase family FAD-binding enzyme, partial [Candidatus Coatesbacteria bacterium]|nr:aminoacetone oxidase family FAD-binding enzyme [Candidatus Coatesbacteria bacterium]